MPDSPPHSRLHPRTRRNVPPLAHRPLLGARRLRDITRHDIQDWIGELAEEGYAPATIQLAHGLVSMAFNAAVDDALSNAHPLLE